MPKQNDITCLLITCFLLSSFCLFSQKGEYIINHISANQGLSTPSVYSIIKDQKGFLWLATGVGLYRYDGYDFKNYQSKPGDSTSLSGNLLAARLFIDRSGDLWVGTKNNGLNRFNVSTEKVERFIHDPSNHSSISHNNIHSIYQDKSGTIWVSTLGGGLNEFDAKARLFNAYYPLQDDPSGNANFIQSVIEMDDDALLVGTRKGLYRFDKQTKNFSLFPPDGENMENLSDEIIVDLITEKEILWIATENGLHKYDRVKKEFTRFQSQPDDMTSLSSNIIRYMLNSVDNRYLWISTVWGLNRFDKQTGLSKRFLYKAEDKNSLSYNMLWGMYLDSSNLLWIGTDNAGVDVFNLNRDPIRHHTIGGNEGDEKQYTATVFYEDSKADLWIGSFEGGLWCYDSTMNQVANYNISGINPLAGTSVFSLMEDNDGGLWVGSSNGGINRIDKSKVEQLTFKFESVNQSPSSIIEILQDDEGLIWLGTLTGLYIYSNSNKNGLVNIGAEPLSKALIRSICEDRHGNLWIGTHSEGLFKLAKENRRTHNFKSYLNDPNNLNSISSNIVMSIYEDADGLIWIATNQGLNRYNPELDQFERFDTKSGLKADYLYHVQGDKNGILWITTSNSIMRFDKRAETDQKSRLIDFQPDLTFAEIYPYSFYLRKSGEIYVGGNYGSDNGYYTFHPDSLYDNTDIPEIAITTFNVRNEPYNLDSAIVAIEKLILKHNENFFSFEFAALDFVNPNKNQYQYKLEGFDNDWVNLGTRRFANYTAVPPGDYTFRVKGSNNDGYWNEDGASVVVIVSPPPWKTWWAYLLYTIGSIVILSSMFYYYFRRQQLLHSLELEQVESEKLKELDTMKTRFFANISHEFRTPLTLILGPLEKLLSNITDNSDRKEVSIARKHAKRLQNLINQIMTISKLEAGKMQLKATEIDIVELIKNYTQAFDSLARQKNIKLTFVSEKDELNAFVDREKLEQVLNNLLSNAFKFTREGGKISISVGSQQSAVGSQQSAVGGQQLPVNNVIIKISDTGIGIPDNQIDHVFDRFYQVERADSSYYQGTGIGLALTKELVELHHGTIGVESKLSKGSTFTILLPLGKDHLKPEETASEATQPITTHPILPEIRISETEKKSDQENVSDSNIDHPILLIVEDNADMRTYIRGYFENEYKVIEAVDGQDGLEKSTEFIPDIIISDLMMPRMDGNEFCTRVKSDERTSHIPVILLTARVSKESRIEGLETGADDFVTKPFDGDELQIRVKNLIHQRKMLNAILEKKLQKSQADLQADFDDSGITSMDEQFLKKVFDTLKTHHSNPEFNVEEFHRQIGLSRIQLHRKIKALTGQTTGEFIRNFRLNRAAELIKKQSATVAEIAYDVGFNSPSYFTECFRKLFGQLPSEYADQGEA